MNSQLNVSFLHCQKFKAEIESNISALHHLPDNKGQQGALERLTSQQKTLETKYKKIQQQLIELTNMIVQLKQLTPKDSDITAQRKLDNLTQAFKQLEQSSKSTYMFKANQLKQEKDRLSLFGSEEGGSEQQDGVKVQIELRDSLNNSHKLVEESLQIGSDVLLSFDRQSNSLKNIQSKVSHIIGDMGFSSSLVKMMGSRDQQDTRIIMALSLVLLTFIGALYYAFKT